MKRSKVAANSVTVIGKRKSREDWIAGARKMLVKSGVDAVKIDRLASELHATRGSFYWHFTDRDDLLNALLHDWEVNNYVAIATIRASWAGTRPDLTELIELWVEEGTASPAFGMAIRTWARGDAKVEEVMHRVDNEWINLLQLLFSPDLYDASERLVRARIVYFHQVGYHALAMREPQDERLRLIPYYYKVLTGHEAGDNLRDALKAFEHDKRPVKASKATSTRRKKS
ncbi:TetR/AcrR family transcriptional regulator [Steroidobacter sp.]|uniref:TetR/AcrR family transcriptional regulator n=1 Tax=Steroidobacter sp. TaxID=1978227 RepID=UPI001A4B7452|nr:TetR/AcrR family transcriptional regulator [Steroidobacter sp.]MBL8270944.1 TetR/AcrR family transcriptional regulator [Steroidobacter sp.]